MTRLSETRTSSSGHLIPAGSGTYRYAEIDIEPPAGYEPPPPWIEEVPVAGALPPQLTAAGLLADEE